MKTIEGYSKEKYTDTSVLLAGGGTKALSDFIGSLTWDSTNKKIKYTPVGGNATDLVTLSWDNISGKPDTFPPSSHTHYVMYERADARDASPTPTEANKYGRAVYFDFVSADGPSDQGTYSAGFFINPWNGSAGGSDWSGGGIHELRFNQNGKIYHRVGNGSGWGAWTTVMKTGDSVSYADSAGSASYADSAGSASSATNATYASYVKDIGNSTAISLKYSSGGYTSAPTYLAAWNGYQITYAQATSYVYVKGAKQIEITKYASEGNLYLTGVAGNPSSATYYQPYTLDSFYMCNTSKSYSSTYSSKYLSVPAIEASYINQYPMGGNVVYLGMAYHSNNSTSGSFTSGPSSFFSGSVSRLEAGRYKITITNSSKQTYYIWPFLQVYSNPPTGHPYEIGWAQFDTATTYLQKSVASGSSYNVQVNCGYLHTQGNWSTSDFLATGDGGSSRTVHWTCVFFGTTAY